MGILFILFLASSLSLMGCSRLSPQVISVSNSSNSNDDLTFKELHTLELPHGEIAKMTSDGTNADGMTTDGLSGNYEKVKDYSRGLGFGKETPIDQQLENKEFYIENFSKANKEAAHARALNNSQSTDKASTERYTLQFATIGNFDAAQARKYQLTEAYGLSLYLKFDPPFYKLQAGHYTDKQKAEDRAADLRDSGISAFVVKLN